MHEIAENTGLIYEFGDFVVDPGERVVFANGQSLHLADKVFDTLLLLIRNNGRLLTKDEMMSRLWEDSFVEESNLAKNISRLRKILNSDGIEFIETLPKRGYRFMADVKEVAGDTSLIVRREMHIRFTQEGEQPEDVLPLARIGPGRSGLRWQPLSLAAILLAVLIAIGFYFMFRAKSPALTVPNAYAPVRLTDSQVNEDGASWDSDDQIRFFRFSANNKVGSYAMNTDGTNQHIADDTIKDLRVGSWSPDGRKVLFTKKNEDPYTMFLANIDGSEERRLPSKWAPHSWSRDGKEFVYNNRLTDDPRTSEIFVYDIESGTNINISDNPAIDSNPAFSPDGRQVVFNSDRDGNAEIYLMNADGSGVRRLTDNPAKEAFQDFSPDGTQIIFNSNRANEKVGIFLMDVNDDLPPVQISDTAYNEEIRPGCWSPDGTQIVFTSDRGGGKDNIYEMAVEPYRPRVLFADEENDIYSPSVSADGKRIAFEAKLADGTAELRVLDLGTGKAQTLLHDEHPQLDPEWSPDGSLIAFTCKIGGNTDVCTVRPDGSDLRNLTQNPAHDRDPVWSPDGTELIFTSDRDGRSEETHLFIMNSDGSHQGRLTQKPGYEMSPSWSADGSRLLFAGDRMDGKSQGLDIFSLDPHHPDKESIVVSRRYHDSSPAISPDGKRIAFESQSDGNNEIYLANSDGSGMLRLTRNVADDSSPRFSADGKRIIFSSNRNGRYALFELTIAD